MAPLTSSFPESSGIYVSLLQDECLTFSSGGGCQLTYILYAFSGSPLSQLESLFWKKTGDGTSLTPQNLQISDEQ